jgi:hypothetical protein
MTIPSASEDAAAAVQALQSAGDDPVKLAAAISAAAFLDAQPGDNRQKLRGESMNSN